MRRRVVAMAVAAMAACMMALAGCTEAYDPDAALKDPTIEASALLEPGTLRVGVNASTYPLAGQANGRMSGLEVDIAAAIAQELGLKVDYVDVGTGAVDALSDGEVDIAMGVEPSEVGGSCWTSDGYAPSGIALFSMDEGAKVPKKTAEPDIAAQTSSLSAWLVTRQYGAGSLVAEDDLKAVFADLAEGQVPYAASDAVVGSYMLNSQEIDAHLIGLMQTAGAYCIGANADNTTLQLGVTQALSTIAANGVLDVICTKWTGGPVDVSGAKLTASAKAEAKKAEAEGTADETPIVVGANAVALG